MPLGAVQNYRNFWMKAKDAGNITAREHMLANAADKFFFPEFVCLARVLFHERIFQKIYGKVFQTVLYLFNNKLFHFFISVNIFKDF